MSKALFIGGKVVAGGRITLLPELHCMGEPTLFIDFLTKSSEPFTWFTPPGQLQWWIQGRGPGGPGPPYFSTKMRPEGPKKIYLETGPTLIPGSG